MRRVGKAAAPLAYDVHEDGVINFKDFAILADQWLDERVRPKWQFAIIRRFGLSETGRS
jgi:hypothetical protein